MHDDRGVTLKSFLVSLLCTSFLSCTAGWDRGGSLKYSIAAMMSCSIIGLGEVYSVLM